MKSFQQIQLDFTRYLRSPELNPLPQGMEQRRMAVYRELVVNNIAGLLSGVFPVIRSLLSDAEWNQLIADFIAQHCCKTPYFLEISEEFLQYLVSSKALQQTLPFICELAHYEWIELAVDVSEEELPTQQPVPQDIFAATFSLSPLAIPLHYEYPVHKIASNFIPNIPEPVDLVVYRNYADAVKFLQISSHTQRLLQLMQINPEATLGQQIQHLAPDLGQDYQTFMQGQYAASLEQLIATLCEVGVIHPRQ